MTAIGKNHTYTAGDQIAFSRDFEEGYMLPWNWTEAQAGFVEMADDIEAGQDRDLGAGNLFSIATPVGVLDDTKGLTPEKAYATVKANFFIDAPVTINLFTDVRFPSPQAVLAWLAGKRILSNGSVTVNIPDGIHDVSAYGEMLGHPDGRLITWQNLTPVVPYTAADMVSPGQTTATRTAAYAANVATLETKYGATLNFGGLGISSETFAKTGRWVGIFLKNTTVTVVDTVVGFQNCAVASPTSIAANLANGGVLSTAGLCSFLSQTNTAVPVSRGGIFNTSTAGTMIYMFGVRACQINQGGLLWSSNATTSITLDGQINGLLAYSTFATTILSLKIRAETGAAILGRAGALVAVSGISADISTAHFETASTIHPVFDFYDGATFGTASSNSVDTTIIANGYNGVQLQFGSAFNFSWGDATFAGCNVDLRAATGSDIRFRSPTTVTFSAGATVNASATDGSTIYTLGVLLPAGSIPAFGVADATGALVF